MSLSKVLYVISNNKSAYVVSEGEIDERKNIKHLYTDL